MSEQGHQQLSLRQREILHDDSTYLNCNRLHCLVMAFVLCATAPLVLGVWLGHSSSSNCCATSSSPSQLHFLHPKKYKGMPSSTRWKFQSQVPCVFLSLSKSGFKRRRNYCPSIKLKLPVFQVSNRNTLVLIPVEMHFKLFASFAFACVTLLVSAAPIPSGLNPETVNPELEFAVARSCLRSYSCT
jgi:hypothetical protein